MFVVNRKFAHSDFEFIEITVNKELKTYRRLPGEGVWYVLSNPFSGAWTVEPILGQIIDGLFDAFPDNYSCYNNA